VAETAHDQAPASIAHPPGHNHTPNLHHHFEDLGQQHHAATLGMWLFLGTEVMFFGGLIAAYLVYRFTTPDVWAAASRHGLNVWLATINTVVLLTSSLAMALAVHCGETGDRKGQVRGLLLTMVLGTAFLGIKSGEYYLEYRENLIPGANFNAHHLHLPTDEDPAARSAEEAADVAVTTSEARVLSMPLKTFAERRAQLFFVFYFTMTGLHFLHMVIGLGMLIIILQMARNGRFTPEYYNPLEMAGLYWHFIDIVWVFLFPLLYLVALHK
jgi:cytochrome c oxidase subunit III